MKLLMIYCERFDYRPGDKSLPEEEECRDGGAFRSVLVGFIHAEAHDEEDPRRCEKYLVKNLKWGARKNAAESILLHSFSHLSESRAGAAFTRELLARSTERLEVAGYDAAQTPFGYFLDLDLKAPGRSTARIFVSF